MIRVGTDKRTIRSAEQLVNGLILCMEEKNFTQISVSDLQKASGVSRATFYRLFDNIQDVLAYKCRAMASEIPVLYHESPSAREEGFLLFSLRYWLEQHQFLEAIFSSGRADILQDALMENSEDIKREFSLELMPANTMDYLVSISMGILNSLLITWVRHGQKETPEQLTEIFNGFGELAPVLFAEW